MAKLYAEDQPAGFLNRISKVAIVGVSLRRKCLSTCLTIP